jgi:DNA topoisomerase-2
METEYASLSVEDHMRSKDMWAGTIERIATPMLIFARKSTSSLTAQYETVSLSPALFKCVDEPIVNALDHAQRCARTTEIRVDFCARTGRITIANNGDGIPIEKRASTAGLYVPQFVFGVVFAGSNMKQDSSSTLGGTNGVGVKLTNIHSREFSINTYDSARALSFAQTWSNGMHSHTEPLIAPLAEGEAGTRVSFLLDYAHFKTEPAEFEPIVFTRVIWAALYIAHLLPRVSFFWNGARVSYSQEQYTRAIFGARAKNAKYRAGIDVLRDAVIIASPNVKKYSMSVINGVMVPAGNHLDYVSDCIKTSAKELIERAMRTNDVSSIPGARNITGRLAIIILWRATNVHWSGQSKDRAQFKAADLRAPLALSESFARELAQVLADDIIARIDSRTSRATSESKQKIAIDKYTPARFCGTRKSALCRLFLAEGNSAMSQVESGISSALKFDYYGVLSLRGVIPNVRKSSVERVNAQTGETQYSRSKKLIDNKFITTLVQVLGIDFAKKYVAPKERAGLRYGGIIGCVDQDLDGVGNIFSLVLNLFHLYWPALLESGYIQRLATPIIRAYPITRASKRVTRVLEFYSDEEYREWSDSHDCARYKIRYYKGLGKHSPAEMCQIMKNLATQIITYQKDDDADEVFNIYLGREPALRREQLSRAPPPLDDEIEQELANSRNMPSSYHLRREAHTYQLDNLHRKINDIIGGTNQVACKILNGCIKIFAQSREERKVADLAGTISTSENYHHGEASLQDAIIRRGFIAPGGNQLPMLLPVGNFGTRIEGGQDAAQARYISARFNARINAILYSAEDYALLDFHIDEGKRGEPHFFVPIIPTAITENIEVPAHGWNIRIWAREVVDVIANVRALIESDGRARVRRMRPCCYPRATISALPPTPAWDANCERIVCDAATGNDFVWRGYIIERALGRLPETWSLGTYEWISDDTVTITELPLCVWTRPYIKEIAKICERADSYIKKYDFAPSDKRVDIQITFNDSAFANLDIVAREKRVGITDPVIIALHLRNKMCDNLNFMMPDDSVHTFESYEDVISYWFPIRRAYYARRIARQQEMLAAWIMYYENVVRYIKTMRATGGDQMARMTVEDAEKALSRASFAPLDIAALESPDIKFERAILAKVRGEHATFAYILNLRERDVTLDGCAKYETALAAKQQELRELNSAAEIAPRAPFIGAKIWLSELDALLERICNGRATDWEYGEHGRYTFA